MAHHKLSQMKINGLSKPGRYNDGGGLYAQVTDKGGFWKAPPLHGAHPEQTSDLSAHGAIHPCGWSFPTARWVLACFDAEWPNFQSAVACFRIVPPSVTYRA
jgi:hypothetical protein